MPPNTMNRKPNEWARVKPDLVVAGSTAQARNVLEMALQDIARLSAENENIRAELAKMVCDRRKRKEGE